MHVSGRWQLSSVSPCGSTDRRHGLGTVGGSLRHRHPCGCGGAPLRARSCHPPACVDDALRRRPRLALLRLGPSLQRAPGGDVHGFRLRSRGSDHVVQDRTGTQEGAEDSSHVAAASGALARHLRHHRRLQVPQEEPYTGHDQPPLLARNSHHLSVRHPVVVRVLLLLVPRGATDDQGDGGAAARVRRAGDLPPDGLHSPDGPRGEVGGTRHGVPPGQFHRPLHIALRRRSEHHGRSPACNRLIAVPPLILPPPLLRNSVPFFHLFLPPWSLFMTF